MADRLAAVIDQQILFGDIGDVGCLRILRQQVIERLMLPRPHFRRNRLVPLLRVGEDGIDVEDNAAERKQAMLDDLSDLKLGLFYLRHFALSSFRSASAPRLSRIGNRAIIHQYTTVS